MKDHVKDRKQMIAKIMQDRVDSRVDVVFVCAVLLPATWLLFVLLLSLGGN